MTAKAARKACLQARVILAKSVALNITKNHLRFKTEKKGAHLYLNILLVSCPGIAVSILFHGGLKCQTVEFQCFRSANVKRQDLKMKVACGVQ